MLVNNAGIPRDRCSSTWILRCGTTSSASTCAGTFCPTRHAVNYWRERSKSDNPVSHPRIINTSSPTGLYGNAGQSNYGAAKAAIAGLTVILAEEPPGWG